MHVLILPSWHASAHAPAAGQFFTAQAQALRRAGLQVGMVYPDLRSLATLHRAAPTHNRFQSSWQDEAGIPTLCYHGWTPPKLGRWQRRLWVRRALGLIMAYQDRCGRPDLIHAHGALWAGIAALEARRRLDIPYALTEHASIYARGLVRPWQAVSLPAVFAAAGRVFAVSRALQAQIQPYTGAAPAAILPNLVDTGFFTLPPTARPAARFRFLTVAMLRPLKGLDVLLEAFATAFPGRPDIELEIGGDGPERRRLQGLARHLGVAPRVRFLGQLTSEEVRAAMWCANCFVLPSRTESFGVVLIEALATGLPVIATKCGGPEDIVTSQELGALVPVDHLPALVHALTRAVVTPADLGRQQRVRRCTIERYGEAAITARLVDSYRAILAALR